MTRRILCVAAVTAAAMMVAAAADTAEAQCCGGCGGRAAVKAAVAPASCPAGCAKPCCAVATGAKKCGPNCTKPCCGPAGATGAKKCGPNCTKPCCAAKPAARTAHLAAALKQLDVARKAIEAGDSKAGLAALNKARGLVHAAHDAAVRKTLVNATCPMSGKPVKTAYTRAYGGKAVGFCGPGCAAAWDKAPAAKKTAIFAKAGAAPKGRPGPAGVYANTVCPIMGSKINAKRVTPALVRTYKGHKVAFCCGGCPAAWDRLSDDQKAAKLANARAK